MNDSNLPPTPPRFLIIHNPTAGRGRRAEFFRNVQSTLLKAGCRLDVRNTTGPGTAEDLARSGRSNGYNAVIIAGGDGTINEAVNGLAGSDVPLGVIPLGTANVLAAELGLPDSAFGIAHTIAEGLSAPVHLGQVSGRFFIQMAGIGFDAFVVSRVRPELKRLLGKGAYAVESIRALWSFSFPRYRLTIDGKAYETASAIVANGHYYGGRFTCAPDARIDRPVLHVCLFKGPGAWNALRYATGLLLGRLDRLSDVSILEAKFIAIEGPAGDPVQGDGDILNILPATISVAPITIRVLRPTAVSPPIGR